MNNFHLIKRYLFQRIIAISAAEAKAAALMNLPDDLSISRSYKFSWRGDIIYSGKLIVTFIRALSNWRWHYDMVTFDDA